ncbi:hypothetical protein CPC08DRAFT_633025 [Agrocybe pediades]|nr:hypothetical protein CPC08DRAFT_633025 [Agrocybe pediades]
MSFSGTPLGQGKRLDHHTFHGKPTSNTNIPPGSYSYGFVAPALGSRSPPKPVSPSRDKTRDTPQDATDEPALRRFALHKQRESAEARPAKPLSSSSDPTKWSYRDTSVNAANALHQAVSEMSSTANPHNNSWASTSSRAALPRSTSVEYENSISTTNKRLAPPPDKHARASATALRKPPSKSNSSLLVPESEGEGDARAKSPMERGIAMARNALGAAAYYVRQHSREPENTTTEQPANISSETSYDYAQEEREFQAQKKAIPVQKKNRMPLDNKAYKPSRESEDEDTDTSDDDEKKKKKKNKKGPLGGPLTNLPTVGSDKRRRRRPRGPDGTTRDEDSRNGDENRSMDIQSEQRALSNPPQDHDPDDSMVSATQGLTSIPEIDETALEPEERQPSLPRRAKSKTPAPLPRPGFSIGAFLGSIVHVIIKLSLSLVSGLVSLFSMVAFLVGQLFGTVFDVVLRRPLAWVQSAGSLSKYLVPGAVILLSWYTLQRVPISSYIPTVSFPGRSTPVYQPPVVPPSNIDELTDRLLFLENAIKGLSVDSERTKAKVEDWIKGNSELVGRLSGLEGRISTETKKVMEVDSKAREAVSRSINSVKQEVEVLHTQLLAQQKQYEKYQKTPGDVSDQDARAKLKILEDNVAAVERGVQEALELSKKAATAPQQGSAGPVSAWWEKVATGSKDLRIKSSDGQDVTGLITHMVDSAVSLMNKDSIAKADYALFSGGARVIPQLTSPVFEVKPPGTGFSWKGLWSGKGGFYGRPPVTALHPDNHNGQCWPFAGQSGRLGVALAAPIYVEEITIDHLAKEVAFDLRAAPREMEVWGMVEGTDNIAKVQAWKDDLAAKQLAGPDDIPYPAELPKNPEFLRLANFTYDINSSKNIQTFPVDPEIKKLAVDFGIVVLRVLSNWGREEYSCIYRFRVHGQQIGEIPLPYFVSS